ncbi:MAG: 30S ribosomal protein S4 [Candidatus Woesearchaeota archaeon]|nr:30S ribosomal protein S4 [Candidatus Woesearchaeota archaeon]
MGDPRKIRRKFSRPLQPWRTDRITSENKLVKEYGLKNKSEIWKAQSMLAAFTNKAKNLVAATGKQADTERVQLMTRLARIGLVQLGGGLDDVLGLNLQNVLNRRLQTIVLKKGLAKTPTQARQFIIHEHITIGNKKITAPGYIVNVSEEPHLAFVGTSVLIRPDHPARQIITKPGAA